MIPKPDGSQRKLGNSRRWWRNSDGLIKAVLTIATSGASGFLCVRRSNDLSTAAVVACDERPARWASRGHILTRLAL
jgi:hypothetical protein